MSNASASPMTPPSEAPHATSTPSGGPSTTPDTLNPVKDNIQELNPPITLSPGCATDPDSLCNLIVNYLPPMMDETQLCHLFGQFGPIMSVKIIYDRDTRESRGYGFVKYVHFFSATHALNSLNGYSIAGKRLKVAYANLDAVVEDYKNLRATAMMFSPQQQMALQGIFYQQMILIQQQEQHH